MCNSHWYSTDVLLLPIPVFLTFEWVSDRVRSQEWMLSPNMCHVPMNAMWQADTAKHSGHSLAEVLRISTKLFPSQNKQTTTSLSESRAVCHSLMTRFCYFGYHIIFHSVVKIWLGHVRIDSVHNIIFLETDLSEPHFCHVGACRK